MESSKRECYIALGSNVGDATAHVEKAIEELDGLGSLLARSSLYDTKPWGFTDQPDFVNAVALISTTLSVEELLRRLKEMEKKLGRVNTVRWGPRVIDLDILTYGKLKINTAELTVPHPGMYERAFVLVPLAEIAPQFSAARDALGTSALTEVSRRC